MVSCSPGSASRYHELALCSSSGWPSTLTLPKGTRQVSLHPCEHLWLRGRLLSVRAAPLPSLHAALLCLCLLAGSVGPCCAGLCLAVRHRAALLQT